MYQRFLRLALWLSFVSGCQEKGVEVKEGGRLRGSTFLVDNSGDAGQFVDMDIDLNDNVHLVYSDNKNHLLKVVQRSPTGLAVDVVDDACAKCLYATIRVGGRGEPQVAYYSGVSKTFTYAYRQEGKWVKEPIEWGEGNGMGARLLVDEDFTLHALYYSGDGWLKHAWRVANPQPAAPAKAKKGEKEAAQQPQGLWANERVDRANGSERVQISFVRLPDGRLAASYLHWSGFTSELRFAQQKADGSWQIEVVTKEENPGKNSALFFDQEQKPFIVFRQALKNRLCLAERAGSDWKVVPLVEDAYNMALASDAGGDLLLAYEHLSGNDPRKGHLRVLLRRGGSWSRYLVDEATGSGSYLDAVFTLASRPVVAYYEEVGHSLKLFVGE